MQHISRSIPKALGALMILLAFNTAKGQQDPMFAQYMFNMLAINPAYAGSAEAVSLRAISRHQWTGFDGAPSTQTLTGHSPVWHESLCLGGTIIRDEHGPVEQLGFFVDVAYRIHFDNAKLSFGLKGGVNIFQGNFSELNPLDPDDIVFQDDVSSEVSPNFGFGVMYYSDRYYVGLSAPKLSNTKWLSVDSLETVVQSGQQQHYFLTAGYVFDLNNYVKFKPSFLVKAVEGAPWNVDLTANFLFYDKFWLGAMYRYQDAVGALLQYHITDAFTAGYVYEYSITSLSKYSGGTHEIMIGYDIGSKTQGVRSPRYF